MLTDKHCVMTAGGDLFHHLDLAGAFDEATAMFYAANVLLVCQHLHCKRLSHKPVHMLILTIAPRLQAANCSTI